MPKREPSPDRKPIIQPPGKARCCCGCFSLRQGAFFVAISEIIALSLFIIETLYLALKDGDVFYSQELRDRGKQVAIVGLSFALISALAIVLLIVAAVRRIYLLVIPHLIWQVVSIVLMLWGIMLLNERMGYKGDPKISIEVPSAITLMIFLVIPACLEIWWLLLMCTFCTKLRQEQKRQQRAIPAMRIEYAK